MINLETIFPTACEAGVVHTKSWVGELVVDLAGYVPDRRLAELVALEPSAGDGAMVHRLVQSCERHTKYRNAKGHSGIIPHPRFFTHGSRLTLHP